MYTERRLLRHDREGPAGGGVLATRVFSGGQTRGIGNLLRHSRTSHIVRNRKIMFTS